VDKKYQNDSWWGPGMAVFTEVTGWIVGPIIVALYLGRFFDNKYETEPWFFLGFTALAFFISTYGIIKIATRFIKAAEQEKKKQTNKKDDQKSS
jgi:F0F1-type ATP synthase assembly protein I